MKIGYRVTMTQAALQAGLGGRKHRTEGDCRDHAKCRGLSRPNHGVTGRNETTRAVGCVLLGT